MSEVLIKRIGNNDRRYLKQLSPAADGALHRLFVVHDEYTGDPEIKRVYKLEYALFAIGHHKLYHIVTEEFLCKHEKYNWHGLDIIINFRLRIDYSEKGFARWLISEKDIWDQTDLMIYASTLAAIIQKSDKYGLDAYVRDCLSKANAELLQANGAASWPIMGKTKLKMPWLEIVDVENVECKPHTEAVKFVAIRPGTVLLDQYRLVRKFGQGGMGQVWKAEDLLLQKNFAIKILAENADANLAENIRNEANVLSELRHHNIATMRGYHKDGNVSFMLMDFVDGCSLEDILRQKGKISETEVVRLLRPIAEAIDYVHDNELVHRDIKPANIMVGKISSSDKAVRAFLCDFGIASKNFNVTCAGWGTPVYCAPEIMPGVEVTAAADIFSFAVTLYQCLTDGACPFKSRTEVYTKTLAPLPNTISFGRMVMRGLSKDPDCRPKRCVELFNPPPAIRQPYEDVKPKLPKAIPPVKQPLDGEVFLEYSILRDYRSMLRNCGMDDAIKNMNNFVKYIRSRDVWHVMRMEAFLKFIESMPAFADVVQEKNMARASRHNLKCWFDNQGWSDTTRLANIRTHYGDSGFTILNAIYDSITRSNLEN